MSVSLLRSWLGGEEAAVISPSPRDSFYPIIHQILIGTYYASGTVVGTYISSSQQSRGIDAITIPPLQMRKLRCRQRPALSRVPQPHPESDVGDSLRPAPDHSYALPGQWKTIAVGHLARALSLSSPEDRQKALDLSLSS